MNYEEQLDAEVETWNIEDPIKRAEKIQRERIRHHKLIRDLLLDQLDTHLMQVIEIGGGPYPVSDFIPWGGRIVVDPCTDEYRRFFPCPEHINCAVEELNWHQNADLVICTNALDHVKDPIVAADRIKRMLRPGGFAAIMCAENNALTNPHPCHEWNLTATDIHRWFDEDFETVWELTYAKDNYRYGWVEFEGKRGQPAFALLLRKCSGYAA